jgi:hypothetical protein
VFRHRVERFAKQTKPDTVDRREVETQAGTEILVSSLTPAAIE